MSHICVIPQEEIDVTLEVNTMTKRIVTAAMTNEELVSLIQRGVEKKNAYQQLFINLKPIILGEMLMCHSQIIDFIMDVFGRWFPAVALTVKPH